MSNKVVMNVDLKNVNIECGQMFIKIGEVYILCHIDVDDDNQFLYSLICLQDGYRWCDPLSLEEIQTTIIGDGFIPIGNVKITVEKLL